MAGSIITFSSLGVGIRMLPLLAKLHSHSHVRLHCTFEIDNLFNHLSLKLALYMLTSATSYYTSIYTPKIKSNVKQGSQRHCSVNQDKNTGCRNLQR